jgi:phospholipid/cholesterol/gamma-HCH transport system substrate-binding protein
MSNELKVGLAVIAAAVLLYVGVRFLRDSPLFGDGPDVVAVFDDAQGLQRGGMVQMSGVQIGRVSELELGEGARVVYVSMSINRGVEVPRDSRVHIGGIPVVGDAYVEFVPPAGAAAGRPLADGDTIQARGGQDLIGAIQRNAAPLLARADTLFGQVLRTYRAAEPTLVSGANDLAAAAAQARFITTSIGRTFMSASEQGTFDRLGGTFERLDAAAAAAERAALNLEALTAEYRESLGGGRGTAFADSLNVAVSQMTYTLRRLDESITGLDQTVALADTTLTNINSTEGSLGLLLNDPSLYNNANGAAVSARALFEDLRANPGRYTRGIVRVF